MYLRLDNHGAIQEMDKASWIDIDWDAQDGEARLPSNARICLKDGALREIALPAYYRGDIYCANLKDGLIMCDDFFRLAKRMGRLSVDGEMSAFFHKKGYLPIGKTLFKEISRLHSNCAYRFSGAQFEKREFAYPKKSRFDGLSDSEQYRLFKETLNGVVQSMATDNAAILLSGGGG